jgi:hypothetical protein
MGTCASTFPEKKTSYHRRRRTFITFLTLLRNGRLFTAGRLLLIENTLFAIPAFQKTLAFSIYTRLREDNPPYIFFQDDSFSYSHSCII